MTKNTVQNKEADVQNQDLISIVKNEVVKEATHEIFSQMIDLEQISLLSEIISTEISAELINQSFMTIDLELTDEQKDKLLTSMTLIIQKSKNHYLAKIKKDERTKKISDLVEINLTNILEELLSGVAKEVNRGALVSCSAVSADTKSLNYNKIELHYGKYAGDITIPTKGLFISTNCLDIIKQSIKVESD